MRYRYAISTEKGTRDYNQDRAACLEGSDSVLLILGDGLGGYAGGDIAADILVDTASKAFLKIRTPVIDEPSLFLALIPVSYTHLTLPTTLCMCRSRWSP